jgi:hypothetical protein
MKNFKLSMIGLLLLGAVACNKNDSSTGPKSGTLTGNVSTDDAADMVAGSLSLSSNGVANITGDVTLNAASLANTHPSCGTTKNDTISRKSATGASITYSYNLTYNFMVLCNTANQPDSLSSSLVYSGSYNGPNISTSNSGSSIFTVGGLESSASDFTINGEYKSSGAFKSKRDTTNAGSSAIDIVIKGLTVQKTLRSIVSGTATISITGDVPKKGNFSFTGTLVFNNNNTATLTINGTVYIINLVTGQRTKQ